MKRFSAIALLSLFTTVPLSAQNSARTTAIENTLNQLHDAASKADGSRYFRLFADDAVYIGTDAGERWTIREFRAFAEPYFAKGTGWTYKPRSRHIVIADIPCHCIAWFDELLDSERYGTSRGTGVLTLKSGAWKISQYALTFPIPNDLARGMTNEIKAFEARKKNPVPMPRIVPHAEWQVKPPLGVAADATRRNKRAGDSLAFRDLTIDVLSVGVDSSGPKPVDFASLRMRLRNKSETRTVTEGSAFNWNGFHVAIVAIYGPGELGGGLAALEVATLSSLPPDIASSTTAGGADMRLRIPHTITHVTLHHTGDAKPLLPGDSPVEHLQNLQSWGESDRNWWDLPYHFLLGLDGDIYEGRDYHFMGETNTDYDPGGHFLISVIGNYNIQEPTQAQLESIADLMAWALEEFDLPLDRIGGHYNYATGTDCPGKNLRKYLEDGTFKRMVVARLK